VVIELFRSFIEYQECQRLRVHSLLSAALVFVVRELVLTMYREHMADPLHLVGFGAVILSLGGCAPWPSLQPRPLQPPVAGRR